MKTTTEAPDLIAPPNSTWAPLVEALEREPIRSVRIRWRRGYGRGRYASGLAVQVEDGDRIADVLSALVDAAERAEADAGCSLDLQADAITEDGRRIGPWRVSLDDPVVADTTATMETMGRLFRQAERTIERLLGIIQKQAETQAANMDRISNLLAPLVQVRAMELEHEAEREERAARQAADERMFEILERLGVAYLRRRYGIDLDAMADDVETDPRTQTATEPDQTEPLQAEVTPAWEHCRFMARNALTDEVRAILRRHGLLRRWQAVAEAQDEAALLRALDSLEAALAAKPRAARELAAHPPVIAAHQAAQRARAAAHGGK